MRSLLLIYEHHPATFYQFKTCFMCAGNARISHTNSISEFLDFLGLGGQTVHGLATLDHGEEENKSETSE
jgi:hypothetical protein